MQFISPTGTPYSCRIWLSIGTKERWTRVTNLLMLKSVLYHNARMATNVDYTRVERIARSRTVGVNLAVSRESSAKLARTRSAPPLHEPAPP